MKTFKELLKEIAQIDIKSGKGPSKPPIDLKRSVAGGRRKVDRDALERSQYDIKLPSLNTLKAKLFGNKKE